MELKELEKKYEELGKEIERLKKEQSVGFKDDPIFLLSIEEYEKYIYNIPRCDCFWWLRSPGQYRNYAAYVRSVGSVYHYGHSVDYDIDCVRPALKLSNLNSFTKIRFDCDIKHIVYCGVTWVKLDDDLYIAETPIAKRRFDIDSNDYENSDIRRFLLNWYEERKNWQ